MNVLHLNENYVVTGGTEVYIYQLQEMLPQYGVQSFFVSVSGSRKSGFLIRSDGNTFGGLDESQVFEYLKEFIEKKEIDLIHIHYLLNPNLIRFCLQLLPVIRSMHAPELFCPGRQKFWIKTEQICRTPCGIHCIMHAFTQRCSSVRPQKLFENYANTRFEIDEASRGYKYILAMSEYMKSEAVLAGISAGKIVVNPYFTPIVELSDRSNFPDHEMIRRVVFVGRLHVSKGVHYLIRSMKKIFAQFPNVILDIVGDGHFSDSLQALIKAEGIPQEKIVFHGWLKHDQIIEKIQQSYLVVFPSIYPEAFGIVGIEAMMCAKPVIAFDVGGVSTWLQNGVNGFLVENKNEVLLTEKIDTLLTDSNLYRQFAEKSRELALINFVPKVHLEKLIELYSKCL